MRAPFASGTRAAQSKSERKARLGYFAGRGAEPQVWGVKSLCTRMMFLEPAQELKAERNMEG
jgi:hypothetical protein